MMEDKVISKQLFIYELILTIVLGLCTVYGIFKCFRRRVALYLQMEICALGCLFLGKLFSILSILCMGTAPEGFHVGYLGIFGCFMFLFSANYGQMDGLIDDKQKKYQVLRLISMVAPIILIVGLLVLAHSQMSKIELSLEIVMMIPAVLSSYYSFKFLIFPDFGFGFVKAIRPCNFFSLAIAFFYELEIICSAYNEINGQNLCTILLALSSVGLLVAAQGGTKKWIT